MKSNARSSITLPAAEVAVLEKMRRKLGARSKVEVVRRALRLLEEATDRGELQRAYRDASLRTRAATCEEIADLDHLSAEGIDE